MDTIEKDCDCKDIETCRQCYNFKDCFVNEDEWRYVKEQRLAESTATRTRNPAEPEPVQSPLEDTTSALYWLEDKHMILGRVIEMETQVGIDDDVMPKAWQELCVMLDEWLLTHGGYALPVIKYRLRASFAQKQLEDAQAS